MAKGEKCWLQEHGARGRYLQPCCCCSELASLLHRCKHRRKGPMAEGSPSPQPAVSLSWHPYDRCWRSLELDTVTFGLHFLPQPPCLAPNPTYRDHTIIKGNGHLSGRIPFAIVNASQTKPPGHTAGTAACCYHAASSNIGCRQTT